MSCSGRWLPTHLPVVLRLTDALQALSTPAIREILILHLASITAKNPGVLQLHAFQPYCCKQSQQHPVQARRGLLQHFSAFQCDKKLEDTYLVSGQAVSLQFSVTQLLPPHCSQMLATAGRRGAAMLLPTNTASSRHTKALLCCFILSRLAESSAGRTVAAVAHWLDVFWSSKVMLLECVFNSGLDGWWRVGPLVAETECSQSLD